MKMRGTRRRISQPCSNCGTSNFAVLCLLVLFAAQIVFCQDPCSSGPCYPSPTDISGYFNVTANSTCGTPAEVYCTVSGDCSKVCQANDPNLTHPASFVNDKFSKETFWKAKNYEYPVVLQLDFGRPFIPYRSIVTFENELPAAMYFLKSNDSGVTYRPITYLATNCTKHFNMPETQANDRDALTVQCFKINIGSSNLPLQVEYSPLSDRDTANNFLTDPEIQAYFLMTNLKMVLVNFQSSSEFDPASVPESLKRSFYFAIQDWDVTAACFCNGQASKCDPNDISRCICERNTDGHNCEKCLPLFNNKTYQTREACEACECNNHANSCTYNETKGYGVCDNCTDNTFGDHCNLCKPSFYRNPAVPQNQSNTCLACACHVPGVNSSADSSWCDGVTGQCACKSRVTGRACDTCQETYWKLSGSNIEAGCEDCRCNLTGAVNASDVCDKVSGQCLCKPLLTGRTCNKCQDGYYGLTSQNPGCTACNCDLAGSVNRSCSSTGQCYCRARFSGDKCQMIEPGFFLPNVDSLTFEAEDAIPVSPPSKRINYTTITNAAGNSVFVVGVVLNEGTNGSTPTVLRFTINIPATGFYNIILRYRTNYNWALITLDALLRTQFLSFSCNNDTQVLVNQPYILSSPVVPANEALDFGKQCMSAGQYRVNLEIPFESAQQGVSNPNIFVDSIVVVPTIQEYPVFQLASAAVQENMTYYYNSSFSLWTWSANSEAGSAALSSVFAAIFGEAQSCNCSAAGSNNPQEPSECARNGGQCSCKTNVLGRTCGACRPDHFNFNSGHGCLACACDNIGANETSCHPETGKCSCMENVIGLQCNSCLANYYNFNSGAGCSPCNCHANYSSNLQCDGNSGICSCKPGINGGKCTGCADQFYNLTVKGCRPCECNLEGTLNLVCNKTTGQCPCKAHSRGHQCDTCPSGFYGLNANHSEGCLKCQCSNKSSDCMNDPGWFVSLITTSLSVRIDNTDEDGWTAVNSVGTSVLVELDWSFLISNLEKATMKVDTSGSDALYFVAPAKYLGDQRFAYTFTLSFVLQQEDASNPAPSSHGDVILEGKWFNQPLVTSLSSPPPSGNSHTRYKVRFVESDWRVGNTTGRQPTSFEMIAVLSHLTSLRIRAKWTATTTQLYTRLGDIALTVSNRTSVITPPQNASNVERCSCPPEYKGQFCEQCSDGYTRSTPNGGPYVTCVSCQCNGHSETCDPETGVCHNCLHNTTGDHCEKCSDGWYGNATNATAEDCSPCPCLGGPYASNQFANTCVLASDGLPTCVNCSQGHQGRNCETCMDGYFGRPWEQDGQCRTCECNNNIDLGAIGNCNTTTGQCLKCLYNTTGFNCEWCAPEFHGRALNKTCTRCNCSDVGAVSNVCNNVTGYCDCQPYVTGKLCGKCEQNAFNYTASGCLPCNCNGFGSSDLQCDSMYGNCSCNPNVIGSKCDMCSAGFFDVRRSCLECNCTANQTATNTTCDSESGQCQCEVSLSGGQYGGRQCDGCAKHTVGSPPTCHPCTETCYMNWEGLISKEKESVSQLYDNVTELLQSFGSMSVDGINSTLQMLKRNVTYADEIFSSGERANLVKKREQINTIKSSIDSLQLELNVSQSSIEDAQKYFLEHVTNFNGSVRIIPAVPLMYPSVPLLCPSGGGLSVIVDWKCIEAMAQSYRQRAVRANETGYANYTDIQSSFSMIQQANFTAHQAARQIRVSRSKLDDVSRLRQSIESNLSESFQNMYHNHSLMLEEISGINTMLQELVSLAQNFGEKANRSLTLGLETAARAKNVSGQRKREAQNARENASNAHFEAMEVNGEANNALNTATEFKENATKVLNYTIDAISNVTSGINTIARVNNMTNEATRIADEVRAMDMPVSLQQIQNLTEDILNTNISQKMVNQTLESAQNGLEQARRVEALSQNARTVAQETLAQVEDIETKLNSSEHIRQQVTSLQGQTDTMVTDINNITQTVEERFSASYSSGQSLVTKINNTLSNMEESLMCFEKSKNDAQNASHTAQLAYNISENAKQTFDNSSASLPPAASQVNSSYDVANASFSEIQQAHQVSQQLLQDVIEAEELLQQYTAQRDELERLGREIQDMDREAEELLAQFSVAADQYGRCAGAA